MYVWNASSYDLEAELQKSLRPVAIHINTTQSTTSSDQQQQILSKLIQAQEDTTNHYTYLALGKLITKVQSIVDSDLDTAPWAAVTNALADTYEK